MPTIVRLLVACCCLLFTVVAWAADPVPGVVVDYSAAKTRQYVGSPGLAILPSGGYVASHDWFGPGSTNDTTVVFGSSDKGATWTKLAEVKGQWWSSLFVHKEALYLLGTSKEYGFCVIRRSIDGGKTWTTPTDAKSGLLRGDGKYHCAPVPVVIHQGRLWRGMEDAMGPGGWGSHFRAFMMSAPVDADLLDAASWTSSNALPRDPQWLGGKFGGWLEGNAVVTPEGNLVDILRVDVPAVPEKAATISVSADGKTASFDPATGFVDMPGAAKKFTIRFDQESHSYWTLASIVLPEFEHRKPGTTRNRLVLMRSADLKSWEQRAVLIHNPDPVKHGYQYVDWLVDHDDIVALVRTAHDDAADGARNNHDANYLTFHRFGSFRTLK